MYKEQGCLLLRLDIDSIPAICACQKQTDYYQSSHILMKDSYFFTFYNFQCRIILSLYVCPCLASSIVLREYNSCFYNLISSMGEELQQLSWILNFLREKDKLTVNPSYQHDMRNLLMSLNNECIDSIKQQFQINQKTMNLQKFLWLLRRAITPEADNLIIYYELTRLFQDIDIDNSDTIQWKEFLEYLSASAWITEKHQTQYKPLTHDKKVLIHAFREDTQYRKQPIKKIIEMQRHNLLIVVNRDNKIEYVNCQKEEKTSENYPDALCQQENKFYLQHVDQSKILSIDYAQDQRLFGVLMTNRNLCFIEDGEIQKNLGIIRSQGSEIQIKYLPIHKLWSLQSANSTLHLFVSPRTTSPIEHRFAFQPHTQPLTGIQEITSPLAVCTSSLDGSIRLWQAATGRLIIELLAKHQLAMRAQEHKGVKGIATYNRGSVSMICSWMFTTEIYIWLPSLSLSKPFAGQLRGHLGLVINCTFTWQGQIVSLDDRRSMRVWNPEKFQCIQTITVQQESLGLFVLKSRPYIVTYSKLIDFFRVRTNSKADLASELAISRKGQRNVLSRGEVSASRLIGTYFSPYYSALVVVTSQQVKILDINSCTLLATLLPPREDEQFTSFSPKGSRRLYLSTSKGYIYQHKIQNGSTINIFQCTSSQDNELKFIFYHEQTNILLSIVESNKNSYLLTYDQDIQTRQPIKQIEFDQTQLMFFQFSLLQQRLYILSQQWLTIWSYDKLVILGKISLSAFKKSTILQMILQEKSQSILLVTEKEVLLIGLGQSGVRNKYTRLYLHSHHSSFIGGALLCQQVPDSYFKQKNQKNLTNQGQPQTSQSSEKIQSQNSLGFTSQTYVLCLANSQNESFSYDITKQISITEVQRVVLKGKLQKIKQKRKTYLNRYESIEIEQQVDLDMQMFSEKSLVVPKTLQIGTISDHFFYFTQTKDVCLFDIYNTPKGEWNITLSKPKRWSYYYNRLNDVLATLQKTDKALARIYPTEKNQFIIHILKQKYFTQEEKELVSTFQRTMTDSGHNRSKQSIGSKNNIKYSFDSAAQKNSFYEFKTGNKQMGEDNPFVKKLQARHTRKLTQQKIKIYDKIQQSLKMKPVGTSTPILQPLSPPLHNNPFIQQIQYLFTCKTRGEGDCRLEQEESVKSKKKQPTRKSTGERPFTSLGQKPSHVKSSVSVKTRIKSSMGDLTKNFMQNKIECHNFLNRNTMILSAAKSSIGKRTRLKL